MQLKDIDWRKGIVLRKWGPKQARQIDRLVRTGFVTWSFGHLERYPEHRKLRSWDFGGMHIELTGKGKLLARRRPRCT